MPSSLPHAPDSARRAEAWERLLAWYASAGRATLPWRHTRDPYAVLVSEIMLQQTQVERVLPKYAAFLEQFPSLDRLASASAAEVIQAWQGLGYNTRAVRLWRIARQVMEEHGGRLPETLEGLMALAGIGRYTAGAIACFAFGLPVATVDTNIRRVLWRVFHGIEPNPWPLGVAAQREALRLAEWALPAAQAYDWQQALMDLGATVCVSRRPACERCPLAGCCAAYGEVAAVALFPSGDVLARLREEAGRAQLRTVAGDGEGDSARAKDAVAQRGTDPMPVTGTQTAEPDRRVAEGRAPYKAARARKAQERFENSSRYFRGRAVDALRVLPVGTTLALAALGAHIRQDYAAADHEAWLLALLAGLERDGLVRIVEAEDGMRVGLP
jgi:A/G-specific adenine glycosylase